MGGAVRQDGRGDHTDKLPRLEPIAMAGYVVTEPGTAVFGGGRARPGRRGLRTRRRPYQRRVKFIAFRERAKRDNRGGCVPHSLDWCRRGRVAKTRSLKLPGRNVPILTGSRENIPRAREKVSGSA